VHTKQVEVAEAAGRATKIMVTAIPMINCIACSGACVSTACIAASPWSSAVCKTGGTVWVIGVIGAVILKIHRAFDAILSKGKTRRKLDCTEAGD